jgi:hypothetical protein
MTSETKEPTMSKSTETLTERDHALIAAVAAETAKAVAGALGGAQTSAPSAVDIARAVAANLPPRMDGGSLDDKAIDRMNAAQAKQEAWWADAEVREGVPITFTLTDAELGDYACTGTADLTIHRPSGTVKFRGPARLSSPKLVDAIQGPVRVQMRKEYSHAITNGETTEAELEKFVVKKCRQRIYVCGMQRAIRDMNAKPLSYLYRRFELRFEGIEDLIAIERSPDDAPEKLAEAESAAERAERANFGPRPLPTEARPSGALDGRPLLG